MNSIRVVCLLLISIILLAQSGNSYAQLQEKETLTIHFDAVTGSPMLQKSKVVLIAPFVDSRLQMLLIPEVAEEVGMQLSQFDAIQSIYSRYQQLISEYMNEMQAAGRPFGQDLPVEYQTNIDALREEFNNLDLSIVLNRCDELVNNAQLQRLGLRAYVEQLARSLGISLSGQELAAIAESEQHIELQYCVRAFSQYMDFLDRVASRLPKHESFIEQLRPLSTITSIDVLLVDAARIENLGVVTLPMQSGFEELKTLLERSRQFSVNDAGIWQLHDLSNPYVLKTFVRSAKTWTKENNSLWNEERNRSLLAFFDAYQDDVENLNRRQTNSERTHDENSLYRIAHIELDIEYLATFYSSGSLDDAARQWTIDWLRQKEIRTHGILGMLLLQEAGHDQPISDEDINAIRDVLKSEIASLKSSLLETYERSISDQIASLPESIRQPVMDTLGVRPEYLLPNLTLISDRAQYIQEQGGDKR